MEQDDKKMVLAMEAVNKHLNNSPIARWYDGRSIFITGGSGFMGKVLVEKLLFACYGVKNIYILMRAKRGKSPEKRIEEMWKLPMFQRLREKRPESFKKIVPVVGDLYSEGLGLSQSDLELLKNNVSVVFHVAATLKLEATLKDAVEQNTAGTARVLDIAKQMKNLKAFAHFSTAFCSADIDVFEEKVYDCPDNPRDVIDVCRWIKPDALEIATPRLISPHPNTYTYSKRLAEKLVADEAENIPVCIIRPSIVTPSALEPVPGWVDSLNGPMGLIVGAGKGVIRSMHARAENRAQIIPVDTAICAAIVATQKLGAQTKRSKEVPVYNLTQDEVIHITLQEVMDRGRSIMYAHPFEMAIWYPDGDIRPSKFIHTLYSIFLHWLPAYFIDALMFIFRQKRFMVRIQKKIYDGLELLEFFAIREWIFRSGNFLQLYKDMTDEDRKVFPMDFTIMSVEDYMVNGVLGARQYLMKEPLSSLPYCRAKQKVLFVIHKLFVYGFYFLLFWMLLSYSTTAKNTFDYVGSHIKKVPVIGSVLPLPSP